MFILTVRVYGTWFCSRSLVEIALVPNQNIWSPMGPANRNFIRYVQMLVQWVSVMDDGTVGISIESFYRAVAYLELICSRRAGGIILVSETKIFGRLWAQLIETPYAMLRN